MSRSVAAVVVAMSLPLLAACGGDDSSTSVGPSSSFTSSEAQPKTLDAAEASAQEWADRLQSEDYAGVWDLAAKEYRDGVSREDFVAYSKSCTLSGPEITATGVRLEGETKAVIRLEVAGLKQSREMVYEGGGWFMGVSDSGRKDIGKKADQMIADAKADGACAGSDS